MITGEIKSQVNQVWNVFWAGGISNPMEVIEQMTYLLFIKRLDELHTAQEYKANRLHKDIENPIFPAGINPQSKTGRTYELLRWSKFKNTDASTMYEIVAEEVFPFIKNMRASSSTYFSHMKDARQGANVIKVIWETFSPADAERQQLVYRELLDSISE